MHLALNTLSNCLHRQSAPLQTILLITTNPIRYQKKNNPLSSSRTRTLHLNNSLSLTTQENQVIEVSRKLIRKEQQQESNGRTSTESWSDHEHIKRQKVLQPLKFAIQEWDRKSALASELRQIIEKDQDQDMREIADLELRSLQSDVTESVGNLKDILLEVVAPTPTSHQASALVELKPGVGGVEASHFATSLMNLYTKCALRKRWNIKPISVEYMTSGQGQDGLREAVLEIEGKDVYSFMKWEAGVHRVQRVPVMQNTAAIHTSTASVIVLPLNPSESDIDENDLFQEKDIKLETMRSQGAGGQHVNKTESAVRLTHVPSGIVVSMQDSRSQHQNKARAYMILRARLLDLKLRQKQITDRGIRLAQVKTSDRSEKIRTYNFQQGRVTDHRIGLTLPRLNDIIEGGETLEIIWNELEIFEKKQIIDNLLSND